MPDFSKGKIYVVRCGDYFYYGSTTLTLSLRLSLHKSQAITGRSTLYEKLREVGLDKAVIELVQDYPCDSSSELRQQEDIFVRNARYNTFCLNRRNGFQTQEDYIQYMKQYRQQKVQCQCGCSVGRSNYARHQKSPRHVQKLNSLLNAQPPS